MSKSDTPKSQTPSQPAGCPRSTEARWHGIFRTLLKATLATLALTAVACEDDEEQPPLPARGISYVTVLNQEGQPMQGCHFDYEIPPNILAEDKAYFEKWGSGKTPDNPCNEGDDGDGGGGTGGSGGTGENGGMGGSAEEVPNKLFVYGRPGKYKINAKCNEGNNKLIGHVNVPIDKGENNEHSSRLINSFCTDEYDFVTDFEHPKVMLNEHLRWSNDAWCANKLSKTELMKTEIVDYILDCTNLQKCNPIDGRDLFITHPTPGIFELTAQIHLVPANEKRTVKVILEQTNGPIQRRAVSIDMYGSICENGIIEPGEECEGEDFQGKSCATLGFHGGDLECVNCEISMDKCVWGEEE